MTDYDVEHPLPFGDSLWIKLQDYEVMRDRAEAAERELAELQAATRWIPVSERVPTESRHYDVLLLIPDRCYYRTDMLFTPLMRWKSQDAYKVVFWREHATFPPFPPLPVPPEAEND